MQPSLLFQVCTPSPLLPFLMFVLVCSWNQHLKQAEGALTNEAEVVSRAQQLAQCSSMSYMCPWCRLFACATIIVRIHCNAAAHPQVPDCTNKGVKPFQFTHNHMLYPLPWPSHLACSAAGGNLQDILREEEAKAAARAAAQPATADLKTAAPGAARSGGWARVAASPTASRGTPVASICCLSRVTRHK